MKRIMITDMMANANNSLTLLISNVEEKLTKKGDAFLNYTLTDGTKEITAKQWGVGMADVKYGKGKLALFNINAGVYNNEPNYIVNSVDAPDALADISDFMKLPPEDPANILEELFQTCKLIKDEKLSIAVSAILERYKERLLTWGAAKAIHHNLRGGLLWHTVRMTRMAVNGLKVYKNLSSDVVIAGTMLHDIGKLFELVTDDMGNSDYTVSGHLFGHLLFGYELVKSFLKKTGVSNELSESLLHVIVSHHGKQEWGAITAPHSAEAFFVSQIDMIDAQIYRYEEACAEINPGEIGTVRIDGIPVYRSALTPED